MGSTTTAYRCIALLVILDVAGHCLPLDLKSAGTTSTRSAAWAAPSASRHSAAVSASAVAKAMRPNVVPLGGGDTTEPGAARGTTRSTALGRAASSKLTDAM